MTDINTVTDDIPTTDFPQLPDSPTSLAGSTEIDVIYTEDLGLEKRITSTSIENNNNDNLQNNSTNLALALAKDIQSQIQSFPDHITDKTKRFVVKSVSSISMDTTASAPRLTDSGLIQDKMRNIARQVDKTLKIASESLEQRRKIATPTTATTTINVDNKALNSGISEKAFDNLFQNTDVFRDTVSDVMAGVRHDLWHVPNIDSKRSLAVKELIESERDYVKDLAALVFIWLDTIQSMPNVSSLHRQIIIRNTHQLLKFHRKLLYFLEVACHSAATLNWSSYVSDNEISKVYPKSEDLLYYNNRKDEKVFGSDTLDDAKRPVGEKSLYGEGETALDIDSLTTATLIKQQQQQQLGNNSSTNWMSKVRNSFRKSGSNPILTNNVATAASSTSSLSSINNLGIIGGSGGGSGTEDIFSFEMMSLRQTNLESYLNKLPNQSFLPHAMGKIPRIGECFMRLKEGFELYTTYCMKHEEAMEILSQLEAKPNFAEYTTKNLRYLNSRLRLVDFFIKPVQRICKYPLILNEIYKCVDPTEDVAIKQEVGNVLGFMDEFLARMNAQKHVYEMDKKATLFYHRLIPFVGIPTFSQCGEMIQGQQVSFGLVPGNDTLGMSDGNNSHHPIVLTYKSYYFAVFKEYTFVCKVKKGGSSNQLEMRYLWKTAAMSFHIPSGSGSNSNPNHSFMHISPMTPMTSTTGGSIFSYSTTDPPSQSLAPMQDDEEVSNFDHSLFLMHGDRIFHIVFPSKKDFVSWIENFRSLFLIEQKGHPCPNVQVQGSGGGGGKRKTKKPEL